MTTRMISIEGDNNIATILVLVSKPSDRNECDDRNDDKEERGDKSSINDERCEEDLSKRIEQICLFNNEKVSKHTRIDYEVNSINNFTINSDNVSIFIQGERSNEEETCIAILISNPIAIDCKENNTMTQVLRFCNRY